MDNSRSTAIAVLSHITIFGWLIALVLNSTNKTDLVSFYLRQTLLLNVISALAFTSFIGRIIATAALVFLILSLISAIQSEKKLIPLIGKEFQNWFKGL